MLNIKYSNQAIKFIKKADKTLAKRIIAKMEQLQIEPFTHDTKTVEGAERILRVRVGDYRILYEVDHKEKILGVVKIDKRPRAY